MTPSKRTVARVNKDQPGLAPHPGKGGAPTPGLVVAILVAFTPLGCSPQGERPAAVGIIEVTDATFHGEVLEAAEPVLLEFWAPWCEPCLEMAPAMEQVASEFTGRVKVARVRVDENPTTASRYDVTAPPVVIVLRKGQVVKRRFGQQSRVELTALLTEAVGPAP